MENFTNSLDKSIFDEMPKTLAFEYIRAKFGDWVKKEVQKIIEPKKNKDERTNTWWIK